MITNKISLIRDKFFTNTIYYHFNYIKYLIRNYIGLIRGLWAQVTGKIFFDSDNYRPLVLGYKTTLNLEPYSKIILKGTNTKIEKKI